MICGPQFSLSSPSPTCLRRVGMRYRKSSLMEIKMFTQWPTTVCVLILSHILNLAATIGVRRWKQIKTNQNPVTLTGPSGSDLLFSLQLFWKVESLPAHTKREESGRENTSFAFTHGCAGEQMNIGHVWHSSVSLVFHRTWQNGFLENAGFLARMWN